MNSKHEMFNFMRQISKDMAMEYDRIQKRASEDPGTAGDEGEESWAELLRNWLPATYHVVTKGRILFEDDSASPQIDILVLTPDYPRHLRNKKMYFAGGVVAAFECKLTLKTKHLTELLKTSEIIKSKYSSEATNPYEEFNAPIFYGLLAHSHSWSKNQPVHKQIFNIMEKVVHPDEGFDSEKIKLYPDVVCVSDTGVFCYRKNFVLDVDLEEGEEEILEEAGTSSALILGYDAYWSDDDSSWLYGTVHGTLISYITHKMAYYDPRLRNLAQYFHGTDISALSVGYVNTLSIDLEDHVIANYFDEGGSNNLWNPWGKNF
ncbi:hypothetical protein Q9F35_005240 [Vibrio harveyi]|uniref:DUF6602 domain-containing protein n=1 Tax=Vibrio harveyi TaxID=669 RepID=UPI000AA64D0E|nr:DUF6602 domain-containing protein [Vibrio harveyi]ELH7813357.1 hypothetical protein [Vibrio harveyi]